MDTTNPDPANIPDDDLVLQNYQDDLDTKGTDRIMDEETDDPTEELGVDPKEFKKELDQYDFGNGNNDGVSDDRREQLEDIDQDTDDDNDSSST